MWRKITSSTTPWPWCAGAPRIIAGSVAQAHNYAGPWELLCAYAVTVHSFTGFAAASRFGEKSVIATDLIDLIGDAMELAAESALNDLGVLDEGSQVEEA